MNSVKITLKKLTSRIVLKDLFMSRNQANLFMKRLFINNRFLLWKLFRNRTRYSVSGKIPIQLNIGLLFHILPIFGMIA